MIVFTIDELEDFITLVPRAITEEIYFKIKRDHGDMDNPGKDKISVILHFVGAIGESSIGLYQTEMFFPRSYSDEIIYSEMSKIFEPTKFKLIKGKITEIFYSVSA